MEYKLVPMAPTREMIEAGQNLLFIEDIYRAMLAAAPSPSWIPVSERTPCWEDADENCMVWYFDRDIGRVEEVHREDIYNIDAYWMLKPRQTPPAPPTEKEKGND